MSFVNSYNLYFGDKPACLDMLVFWTKKIIKKRSTKKQFCCADEPEDLHIDVSQSKVAYFPDLEIFHINQDQYKDKDRENDKDRWPCSIFHIDKKIQDKGSDR